ncbi:MAG: cobalamin-dependent protein [Deltaproteobacteria bacterium]|nr:cobalamin-dependent protein [Deltaproteobacteria bacterium]
MRVLLINPPRENEIIGNNPPIIEEKRGVNPPLGILYVAGYLEKYTDHTIQIIDCQVERLDYEALEERVRSLHPDVVGMTAMTMTLIDVIKTIDTVKRVDAGTQVVLGGPHVHIYPEETIHIQGVDFVVLGEGEECFKELLENMDDLGKLRSISGLVFKDNGEVVNTGIGPVIEDLDALPFPARHLVPYKKYNSLLTTGNVVTTLFTSRGCPYQCTFCDRPHLGRRFRARSAINVVDEIEECVNMGIRDFLFYDDTFAVNRKRVLDICDEIAGRRLKISWDIRTRVDTVDGELLKKLKNAGCKAIHYGVEAGSDKILKILKKEINLGEAKQIFDLTRRNGIEILAYFMIGNPTENRDNIEETFRVIKHLDPDYLHLTILTPFPGTEIYAEALQQGIISKDCWREFAKNPTPDFVSPHWNELFSREELNQLLVKGYRAFYLRPSYIMKRLIKVRTLGEFLRKASAGVRVAGMR